MAHLHNPQVCSWQQRHP